MLASRRSPDQLTNFIDRAISLGQRLVYEKKFDGERLQIHKQGKVQNVGRDFLLFDWTFELL